MKFRNEARATSWKESSYDNFAKLNADSQKELDNKNRLEQQAIKTKKKINTAETLINSLSDEKLRWAKGASCKFGLI